MSACCSVKLLHPLRLHKIYTLGTKLLGRRSIFHDLGVKLNDLGGVALLGHNGGVFRQARSAAQTIVVFIIGRDCLANATMTATSADFAAMPMSAPACTHECMEG